MNVSPDEVRAATRSAAAVVTPDNVPPLRLDEPAGRDGRARRARPAWVAPLAAAAGVVIVAVASAIAGSLLARSVPAASPADIPLGAPASSGAAAQGITDAHAYAGVPRYYVAVKNQSLAQVRATATGATLAEITTSTPFVGVTGAADDRTFVLDAQRQVMGPTVLWPEQPKFYLLRLTASGAEQSFTQLALAALPKGTAVTGLALSPDGSKLAVEVDTGGWGNPGLLEMRVYTLATGAYRAWFTNGSTDPEDPGGFTGSGVDGAATISWAADSKTIAFDWMNRPGTIGVRLLDTAAGGDNLIADSRLAVIEFTMTSKAPPVSGPPDYVSQCVTDSIMSADGSAVVCGYDTGTLRSADSYRTTTGFIRYSTKTGKPAQLYGVSTFNGQSGGDISVWWTNATGKTLIGGIGTPSGIRVGVITGQTFTPLPGTAGLGAVAW